MRDVTAFVLLMVGMGLLIEVISSPTPSAWRTGVGFVLIVAATFVGFWGEL